MDIGYCRVSTDHQNTDLQLDALNKHGCQKVFTETPSGALRDRPQLKAAIEFARSGDVLVVWSLSRLGRRLRQLIETIEQLECRGIGNTLYRRDRLHISSEQGSSPDTWVTLCTG